MFTVVHEICPTEGLGEYVGVLLGRSYVLHRKISGLENVANEVVTHVYVFASGRAQREDTVTEHASAGHPRCLRSFDVASTGTACARLEVRVSCRPTSVGALLSPRVWERPPLLVLVLLLLVLEILLLVLLLLVLEILLLVLLLPGGSDDAAGSPSTTPPAPAPVSAVSVFRIAVSMGPTSVTSRSDSPSKSSSALSLP